MARKRKPPKLRLKGNCYIANFYKPDGTRTTMSFGPTGERTAGQIHQAFEQWLDLYTKHPDKTLSYDSPYDAIAQMVSPTTVRTVGQLYQAYLSWAEQSMPPLRDGQPASDLLLVRRLGKFLSPYEAWAVGDFGPDELRDVQGAMVDYRYSRSIPAESEGPPEQIAYTRTGINRLMSQARKMWQWAAAREIVPIPAVRRMREVKPLRIGRSPAKDALKRLAVTEQELDAVTEKVTRVVADMLRLMWTTAMRPSEVCRMRPFDILRDDPLCWLYVPGSDVSHVGDHKTAHHQRVRAIPLASRAQAILRPRIADYNSKEHIFSPVEAVQELLDRRAAERKTPQGYGNRPGTNRKEHPMIRPGTKYSISAFCVAVKRGCKRAGVARFTPRDIRRTAATRIRSRLSKDDARLILGQVSVGTTEIYLLEEVQEAMKVAKKLDASDSGSDSDD